MRAVKAKMVRKYSKRNWIEYYQAMRKWPFSVRFRFCWQLLFGMKKWR